MLAFGAIGETPIAAMLPADAETVAAPFETLLADTSLARRFLIEISPRDIAGAALVTLRYSSNGFVSTAADTPASTLYAARAVSALEVERSIMGGGPPDGRALATFGQVRLLNGDGGLDAYLDGAAYAFDGRDVIVKMGGDDFTLDQFGVVFTGAARRLTADEDTISVVLSGNFAGLDADIQANTYAGTGGAEGGDDLAGKQIPRAFGYVREAPAPPVDPATLTYQVNDGAVSAIDAVYDNGVALVAGADYASYAALVAASITAGDFATSLATGYFRLGSSPAGSITADVAGHKFSGVYHDDAAGLIRAIAVETGGLTDPDHIDAVKFSALTAAQPATVGYWTGTGAQTIADVFDRLARGIGAGWGRGRAGLLTIDRLIAPSGIELFLTTADVLSIERVDLQEPWDVPVQRIRVNWRRIWQVPGQDGLAGAISDARRAYLAEETRVSEAEDTAIATDYALAARPDPIDGLFDLEADAAAEAARLLALFKVPRQMYRVNVVLPVFAAEIGQTVHLTYKNFGLSSGWISRLVGMRENVSTGDVELLLWG